MSVWIESWLDSLSWTTSFSCTKGMNYSILIYTFCLSSELCSTVFFACVCSLCRQRAKPILYCDIDEYISSVFYFIFCKRLCVVTSTTLTCQMLPAEAAKLEWHCAHDMSKSGSRRTREDSTGARRSPSPTGKQSNKAGVLATRCTTFLLHITMHDCTNVTWKSSGRPRPRTHEKF